MGNITQVVSAEFDQKVVRWMVKVAKQREITAWEGKQAKGLGSGFFLGHRNCGSCQTVPLRFTEVEMKEVSI